MRVILTHPDTGDTVAVDDWHTDWWHEQGYVAPVKKRAAKKAAAKPVEKSTG